MSTVTFEASPESPEPAPARAVDPMARLRELLALPEPEVPGWQDEAGRSVSLLAIRFPQEKEDVIALAIVALLGYAAAKGVKEAKKRALKLVRWADTPPPELTVLTATEEQRAAVNALAKLKAPWANVYAVQALNSTALPLELLPDILRWVRAASPSLPDFIDGPLATAIGVCPDLTRALAILRDAIKLLHPTAPMPAQALAAAVGSLVASVMTLPGTASASDEDKSAVAVLQVACSAIELAWQAVPAVLLQPALLIAAAQVSNVLQANKRTLPASVDAACMATLGLLADGANRFGTEAIDQWRPLMPLWKAAYPNFESRLAAAAVSEPALAPLVGGAVASDDTASSARRYVAEDAFAALLPAWDAFALDLPDPSKASSLGHMLRQAAGTAGVEPFGVVGESIGYDPLAHHLSESPSASPARVKVVRSGVLARRVDGSTRILVQALVRIM